MSCLYKKIHLVLVYYDFYILFNSTFRNFTENFGSLHEDVGQQIAFRTMALLLVSRSAGLIRMSCKYLLLFSGRVYIKTR